jgi:hypothetical protein
VDFVHVVDDEANAILFQDLVVMVILGQIHLPATVMDQLPQQ